jgi:hypothetical protein
MPLELSLEDPSSDQIGLKLKERDGKRISVAVRKTLDGHIMVTSHHNFNIVIIPDKGKILSVPKNEYSDETYNNQDEMFKYLVNAGVVLPDSINAGSIYGSLEGKYPTDKKNDEEPLEVVIYNLHNFLNKQKGEHAIRKKYMDELEQDLLNPGDDDTTELGEIPQAKTKGSIPKWGFPTRGIYRYNY